MHNITHIMVRIPHNACHMASNMLKLESFAQQNALSEWMWTERDLTLLYQRINYRTISKFDQDGFSMSVLVFVSRLWIWKNLAHRRSWLSVLHQAIFCHVTLNVEENWDVTFEKFSSDLNEIWYIGRGRWVVHDGMSIWPDPRSRSRSRAMGRYYPLV